MPETLVLCGEAAAHDEGTGEALRLRLTGKSANIRLELSDIEKRMLSNVKAQLADLIEVAAYVYCADQLVSRGGEGGRCITAQARDAVSQKGGGRFRAPTWAQPQQ